MLPLNNTFGGGLGVRSFGGGGGGGGGVGIDEYSETVSGEIVVNCLFFSPPFVPSGLCQGCQWPQWPQLQRSFAWL